MLGDKRGVLIGHGERGAVEADTSTCQHCNRLTVVKPGQLPNKCFVCDSYICDACHAKRECVPIERWLEQQEARNRAELERANRRIYRVPVVMP